MNYSFMSFSCPDLTLDEMLSLAKTLGYNAIEPRSVSNHAHGVEPETDAEQRAVIKEKAANSGIALCCVATSCRYADPATVAVNISDTHRFIDLAGDIGVSRLRVFGGKIGDGLSREDAVDEVSRALVTVAHHAEERDVTLCLETHDDWCDPVHVAEVMRRVDHPNIAVNWDILHPVRTARYTVDQAFDILQPWIEHVHIHDSIDEKGKFVLTPIGGGICDHRRALELLRSDGYTGFLSGEWINWEPYETHLPRELGIMQKYENEWNT